MKYDSPFEVTSEQYKNLMNQFAGIVAGKEEDGKYYIKVWFTKYIPMIEKVLELR